MNIEFLVGIVNELQESVAVSVGNTKGYEH
jgi:hypothetical protein